MGEPLRIRINGKPYELIRCLHQDERAQDWMVRKLDQPDAPEEPLTITPMDHCAPISNFPT